MKTTGVLVFLFAAGCGKSNIWIDNPQGFDISEDLLWNTFYIVESNAIAMYPEFQDLDVDTLIEERNLTLELKSEHSRSDWEKDEGIGGWYHHYTNHITIYVRDEDIPLVNCYSLYRIVAHEFTHFLADEYLHWKGKPHMYPYMFFQWAGYDHALFELILESKNEDSVMSMCQSSLSLLQPAE